MEDSRAKLVRLGGLPRKPTTWLWTYHGVHMLPRGKLCLVEGKEGLGKGYFCAWAAVQMVSGAWGRPRPAVWVSSEEEPDEIQARLFAAGWCLDAHAPVYCLQIDGGDTLAQLPRDRDVITNHVSEMRAGLVVVDPLRDHSAPTPDLGVVTRSNNDEAWIRPAARAWNRVGIRTGACVIGLHHQNKSETGSARSRSTGSGGWRHVARHVLVFEEVHGRRAFAQDKTNLCREDRRPFDFDLESVTMTSDNGDEPAEEGCFVPGERLVGHENIDHWRTKQLEDKGMDPADVLEWWLGDHVDEGASLPARDQLKDQTGLASLAEVKRATLTLVDRGRIRKFSNSGYVWLGNHAPSPNGADGDHDE